MSQSLSTPPPVAAGSSLPPTAAHPRLARFAWFVVAYNLLVIMFGAFVRATHSGAGCGSHWPLCDGEVVPSSPSTEKLIEFTHRSTSGIALLLVAVLAVWAFRAFPRKHPVRLGAVLSVVFIVVEALIGAGLVLLRYVADDERMGRAFYLSGHLVNTLILVGALTLTAWWASGMPAVRLKQQGAKLWMLLVAAGITLLLVISGGIAALGDTLYPATSLRDGLSQDFSPTAHVLLRLRIFHPLLAIVASITLIGCAVILSIDEKWKLIRHLAVSLVALVVIQLCLGVINLALLAPTWMQLVHLLFSQLVWMAFVLLGAATLADRRT
jgi:heme A synthase